MHSVYFRQFHFPSIVSLASVSSLVLPECFVLRLSDLSGIRPWLFPNL
jgi:hypothetical protein